VQSVDRRSPQAQLLLRVQRGGAALEVNSISAPM
jgi:hypothetical protein